MRKLFKNKWVWIVVGTIILASAIFGSQGSSVEQMRSVDQSASSSAQTNTEPTVTEQPARPVIHKQDETVTTGGYTASVESVYKSTTQYTDLQPGQFTEVIVVDVTVPSDGSNTWVARTMVTLTDASGNNIDRVMNTNNTSWTPKPGAQLAILNEFIFSQSGTYTLCFKGLAGSAVYWSVTVE